MSNICSSKSYFVQPNVVCPAPAVPAVPTFCTPAMNINLIVKPNPEMDISEIPSVSDFQD
jgi:hypothetical protein